MELVLTGGKSVAEAIRDLGMDDSTLDNWVKQTHFDPGQQEGLNTEERARMQELEQENAKLRMERALFKRAHEPCRQGWVVNHKRVQRLMREHGIVGASPRKQVRTKVPASDPESAPDLLNRDFTPGVPGQRWVGDITYVSAQGWSYLAVVLDIGSRRVLGYAMTNHLRTAVVHRLPGHRSDRPRRQRRRRDLSQRQRTSIHQLPVRRALRRAGHPAFTRAHRDMLGQRRHRAVFLQR
ncbi:transposase InsO family protein [Saccharopolyspora lacisalsi]|uniref:Transposase InsO family protein n=1 Tax=Halosaccharopolyspora lacisalsi TaxID=1000566 RepID=A0A839DR02_9PSEU|nr:DDE-type integrase/transposase/recombinase [Halosaccharopolyspora lacisalsi]MBA8823944.1 transposase InsO family protein [Halosaccharopolyspora lacisalsi]